MFYTCEIIHAKVLTNYRFFIKYVYIAIHSSNNPIRNSQSYQFDILNEWKG